MVTLPGMPHQEDKEQPDSLPVEPDQGPVLPAPPGEPAKEHNGPASA